MARRASRLAWALWSLGVIAFSGAVALSVITHSGFSVGDLSQAIAFFSIGTVGLVLVRSRPDNAVGWLYLCVWLTVAVVSFAGRELSSPLLEGPGGAIITTY